MALDILYTEEATREVRGHMRKEEAEGPPQVTSRLVQLQPLGPRKALHMLSEEAPVNVLPHFFPKSVTKKAMSYGSEACQFLAQVS